MELIASSVTTSCSSDSTDRVSFQACLPSDGRHEMRRASKNNEKNNAVYNTIHSKASRFLVDGTINNTTNRNVFIDIPRVNNKYDNIRKPKPIKTETYTDDRDSVFPQTQCATCSKSILTVGENLQTGVTIDDKCIIQEQNPDIPNKIYSNSTGDDKRYSEKTTYCRPVLNLYNQEFIYKTIERNARLQGLVKKLVLAREKEKQKDAWNNYINDLKNKYRNNKQHSNKPSRLSHQYRQEDDISGIIDDYYRTRFTFKQSNPCQNLLEDFYGAYNQPANQANPSYISYEYNARPPPNYNRYYGNDRYCYPTASEGSFMMLKSAKQNQPQYKQFHGNTVVVDRYCKNCRKAASTSKQNCERIKSNRTFEFMKQVKNNIVKSMSTQTVLPVVKEEGNKEESFNNEGEEKQNNKGVTINENERRKLLSDYVKQEKYKQIMSNGKRLKQDDMTQNDPNPDTLVNIENKLNNLIKTMNLFMMEIRSKTSKYDSKSASILCKFSDSSIEGPNMNRSDTSYGLLKREQIICGMAQDNSSPLGFSELNPNRIRQLDDGVSRIDKILCEEMNKSNKAKRDIENILKGEANPCAVQITFDIPTRECSTEVTASLSRARIKDKEVFVEEIKTDNRIDTKAMTIAVNTDPLSWLALFRISTETFKQLLSYMPNIDYLSYLSMLQFPQISRNGVSHYVCYICGAAFGRPSQLSDNIQERNLSNTRDCCVCRHVLDLHHTRRGLFACQYCGHRFTRAYCCELHQQACAKRLGRNHDVSSDLMLLR